MHWEYNGQFEVVRKSREVDFFGRRWSICQTTFSDVASPFALSPRFTGRNTQPSDKPAADTQASIATFTQVGIQRGGLARRVSG